MNFHFVILISVLCGIVISCPSLIDQKFPPPPIILNNDFKCFDLIDQFTKSEEILFIDLILYSGTGTDTGYANVLYSSTKISLSIDSPKLHFKIPLFTSLPAVDLLVINVKTSWYTTTFERYVLSGISQELKELMYPSHTDKLNQELKFNLGSGISLLSANKGWVNFDALRHSAEDWGSVHFQANTHSRNTNNSTLYLIKWDVESGLHFMPDNSVNIININCMLYYIFAHRGSSSLKFIIKEIFRVLKPFGILRITESSKDISNLKLKNVIKENINNIFGKENYRNVGPFRTFTGDLEALHVTHENCLTCVYNSFNLPTDQNGNRSESTNDNLTSFQRKMIDQGCWICHVDVTSESEKESIVQNCEMNDYTGIECESVGRWLGKPVDFGYYFAIEAIKSIRSKNVTRNLFTLKREKRMELDVSSNWPFL
jgi:SAM-dependent methyltransferase